jgi:hypothetical protein
MNSTLVIMTLGGSTTVVTAEEPWLVSDKGKQFYQFQNFTYQFQNIMPSPNLHSLSQNGLDSHKPSVFS